MKIKMKPSLSVSLSSSHKAWNKGCCSCYDLNTSATSSVSAWMRPGQVVGVWAGVRVFRAIPWASANLAKAFKAAGAGATLAPALN